MKNCCLRFSKLFRLSWLILPCMLLSGCLFGPNGCGAPPPKPDTKNLLTIQQRYDYFKHEELAALVCIDESGYYFLRPLNGNTEVCHALLSSKSEVLYTIYYGRDIAIWGDKLVVVGRQSEEEDTSLLVMDKTKSLQSSIRTYPYVREKIVKMPDGNEWKIWVEAPLLRLVFNRETRNVPIETLLIQQTGYGSSVSASEENWEYLFLEANQSVEAKYTVVGAGNTYAVKAGDWMYLLDYYNEDNTYILTNSYYIPIESQGTDELPCSFYSYYNPCTNNLCMFDSYPYFIRSTYSDKRDNYSPTYLWPVIESGKSTKMLNVGEGYYLRKRYPGEQGRMQYFAFTSYDEEQRQNYDDDMYDLQFLTGHKILAVDLETMQQTGELTLSTPREQVLYVNEAGAYTWRQEESRIFFTPWQGEAVAVSDVSPYVPRYETPEDEKENDACNVWYAEVDAARNRLLLFDMTQGETALLAVVDLPY